MNIRDIEERIAELLRDLRNEKDEIRRELIMAELSTLANMKNEKN